MIFDTHTHYDDKAYDGDRDELLSSFKEKGICIMSSGTVFSVSRTTNINMRMSPHTLTSAQAPNFINFILCQSLKKRIASLPMDFSAVPASSDVKIESVL